ncbi:RluA family pseudouridine synthase [Lactobacillus sp. S2-2]|uniref:RluA family pseudouridine synthase n=1 Tax=Lactobacillus sp. S2-2 TaxID=2692917 RepID=UPI001F45540F|nr:RluA family pseudouridine synthase [Lactobacillus sp. S2-2]MCF6514843.1 RluA family pseudouridine synthase [Lactobacillus sp. S2-2]
MINFSWIFTQNVRMKLRTFLMDKGITRTLLKKLKFNDGKILVNNVEQNTNYILQYNDEIKIILPAEEINPKLNQSKKPIDILYENDNFIVINKPIGLASVPSHLYFDDNLVSRVLYYYVKNNYPSKKVHIVNRLDRDTSGPVIFAKNHFAHSVLDKQLKEKTIKKYYYALVKGNIVERKAKIILPIGRKDDSFIEREVRNDGKYAETDFTKLKSNKNVTFVKIQLHTGRTHQIRVHFSAIGHPLLGDWLYNPNNQDKFNYQALHCYQIIFFDPFQQKEIKINAPLPLYWREMIG